MSSKKELRQKCVKCGSIVKPWYGGCIFCAALKSHRNLLESLIYEYHQDWTRIDLTLLVDMLLKERDSLYATLDEVSDH